MCLTPFQSAIETITMNIVWSQGPAFRSQAARWKLKPEVSLPVTYQRKQNHYRWAAGIHETRTRHLATAKSSNDILLKRNDSGHRGKRADCVHIFRTAFSLDIENGVLNIPTDKSSNWSHSTRPLSSIHDQGFLADYSTNLSTNLLCNCNAKKTKINYLVQSFMQMFQIRDFY